ncbi:MAG: class I SAM-dependent methyltransferase [Gaiellaceae bacterium]
MHRFWNLVIHPLLDAVQPSLAVEIGAAEGRHSRLLADYCRDHGAALHVIDPAPRFDPQTLTGDVAFHRRPSLQVLAELPPADVVLIDGDHNWYTVFNELQLLQSAARSAGRPTPVVACHDVCWPYGRRDLYYDPETIPVPHRRPWAAAGLVRGRPDLVPNAGLNAHLCNAVEEGGRQNGVLTAVEDFVAGAGEEIAVTVLPALYGLALLVPESRATSAIEGVLTRWRGVEGWQSLLELVEEQRASGDAASQGLQRLLARTTAPRLGAVEDSGTLPGRPFASGLPTDVLEGIQLGTLAGRYRGVSFLKSPFDVSLYLQLIGRLAPRTIVEIGSREGGSALWFADLLAAHGIGGRVVSVDRDPPTLSDPRITFLRGDAENLGAVLTDDLLESLDHPLLVTEDSAHRFETTSAVLEFFHSCLLAGDYVVVEDGILADLPDARYREYENGPNRAVAAFLERHPESYAIDTDLCDRYGYNATWSPNAWLRRR